MAEQKLRLFSVRVDGNPEAFTVASTNAGLVVSREWCIGGSSTQAPTLSRLVFLEEIGVVDMVIIPEASE